MFKNIFKKQVQCSGNLNSNIPVQSVNYFATTANKSTENCTIPIQKLNQILLLSKLTRGLQQQKL